MIRGWIALGVYLALLVGVGIAGMLDADAGDLLPKADDRYEWAHGPLLTCFDPAPLIAALQPGVQGVPAECITLQPPVPFTVIDGPFWIGEFQWEGAPIEVGVYAFQIDGNPVTLYTALTARP